MDGSNIISINFPNVVSIVVMAAVGAVVWNAVRKFLGSGKFGLAQAA